MIRIGNPGDYVELLKRRGEKFYHTSTTMTETIEIVGKKDKLKFVNSDLKLNNWELNLITSVKKYVLENVELPVPYLRPVYIDMDKAIDVCGGNMYEVDLTAAFWHIAFMEGFISEDIYKKGLSEKISKKVRLIALGNLAKIETVSFFDGQKFSQPQIIPSNLTEGVFFNVAQKTSELMLDLKFRLGKDFLFFWCDAIFFRGGNENLKNVKEYINSYGLQCKAYRIDEVKRVDEKTVQVFSKDHKTNERTFNFLKK